MVVLGAPVHVARQARAWVCSIRGHPPPPDLRCSPDLKLHGSVRWATAPTTRTPGFPNPFGAIIRTALPCISSESRRNVTIRPPCHNSSACMMRFIIMHDDIFLHLNGRKKCHISSAYGRIAVLMASVGRDRCGGGQRRRQIELGERLPHRRARDR